MEIMNMKTYIQAFRSPIYHGVELYIGQIDRNTGRTALATNIEFKMLDGGEYVPPVLTLKLDEAQEFIDQLWEQGFRPSSLSNSDLSAQKKHLEDMRKIAFKFLELE